MDVGERHTTTYTFEQSKVVAFAELTGDDNPLHVDPDFARTTRFKGPIVHGAFVSSIISRALGREFPGPGTIYLRQDAQFLAPVATTDQITVELEVLEILERGRVKLRTDVFRQDGTLALRGTALVIAPKEAPE